MDDTTQTAPVACTLTSASQRTETTQFREDLTAHILERETLPTGARLTFSNIGNVKESVYRLVALDKGCCSFLDHHVDVFNDTIILTVTGEGKGIALAREFLQALEPTDAKC